MVVPWADWVKRGDGFCTWVLGAELHRREWSVRECSVGPWNKVLLRIVVKNSGCYKEVFKR